MAMAEEARPALATGESSSWVRQIEDEHDNLRAALRWLIVRGASAAAVRLAAALGQFWHMRGYLREGRQWLEQALALSPEAPDAARARALEGLGTLTWNQGDYAVARANLEESRALFERLGDRRSFANVLKHLGTIALNQEEPDYERATALFEECLELRRALDHQRGVANSLNDLALVAIEQGDYPRAKSYLEDGLRRARALGAERLVPVFLVNLGLVGLYGSAEPGARPDAQCHAFFAECLARAILPEDSVAVAYALAGLASLACRGGHPERAACLAGASEGVCIGINFAMPIAHRARFDRYVAAARAQLDTSAWATAWTTGYTLTAEQALSLALAER
jgi:tetratricopeptide (TPR) repeat protein